MIRILKLVTKYQILNVDKIDMKTFSKNVRHQ